MRLQSLKSIQKCPSLARDVLPSAGEETIKFDLTLQTFSFAFDDFARVFLYICWVFGATKIWVLGNFLIQITLVESNSYTWHSLAGEIEMEKIASNILGLPWKQAHWELWNEHLGILAAKKPAQCNTQEIESNSQKENTSLNFKKWHYQDKTPIWPCSCYVLTRCQ